MMTTKFNIPLQGIIVDDVVVVDEDPLRKLEPKEYQSHAVDLARLNKSNVVAEVGGKLVYFSNQAELENFVREQIEWEAKIGPVRPKNDIQPLSSWTEGLKTVLFIRVDFPDRPGEPLDRNNQPLTQARAQDLMNNAVNPFYINNSYNKTSLQTTVTTVVRMPQPQTYYNDGGNLTDLFNHAEGAARSGGFEPNNFNLKVIAFSRTEGYSWSGIGGGPSAALNGSFDLRVTAHELGHCYGLGHASYWKTTDGTVIGNGNNVEYGDPFDVMGGGGSAISHFNARYKRRLDWLTDANVQTVTNDGVYRIFAHDSSTPGGIHVLKVRKNSMKNYWIEYRQLFNFPNTNGATIRWDYLSYRTQILDMTPNTTAYYDDFPLLIGQSFYDNENRIRMTVLGKGNTTPESLDVRVELNVGCSFSLGQTVQNFSASGGEGSITVNTQGGCRPSATTDDNWLGIASSESGTGNATVSYIVTANYGSQPRTGTLTIAGQTFTVQQGAATTACVAPPSGLVAWWRGELNALDQTGVNNGTLINNMTFGGGRVGGGFLGNYNNNGGIVEVPDSPSLSLNRSMTFEGWLKVNSYGGTVIQRQTPDFSSVRSYDVYIGSSGELSFTVWYNNNSGVGVYSDPLPLGQFVHFAASLDDGTGQIKMYINGSLVRQFTITQRPNIISGAKITIGSINGITDELSAYNRALSASEIRAIYVTGTATTGATGKCLSPLGGNSGTVQFSSATYSVNENAGNATITVTRAGDTTGVAHIAYVTVDDPAAVRCDTVNGTAYARCDYATSVDTLTFAPGEMQKTFTIPLIDDAHVEGNETVQLRLSNAAGATLGAATLTIVDNDTAASVNPIFNSPFFVRMQYLDFLSREPEADGLAAWLRVLNGCSDVNGNPACDRILVSSSFFRSQEFQLKGYFVYLFYKAAFNRRPHYDEIISDMRGVTGQTPEEVYAKKAAFANGLAARQEFRNAYEGMTNTAYVDALLGRYSLAGIVTPDPANPDGTAVVTLTRNDLINRLDAQTLTRAQVLRAVVQSREVDAAEYNGAFVAMQYYGYLRREPEEGGYQAWLRVLNANPSDSRVMVNGFMNSAEYYLRFGKPPQ